MGYSVFTPTGCVLRKNRKKCLLFIGLCGIIISALLEFKANLCPPIRFRRFRRTIILIFEEVSTVPNIKSAKKRVKVAAAKTLQNKMINSELKTEIKKANAALEANAPDKAEAVKVAISDDQDEALGTLITEVCQTMQTTTDIYAQTIAATLKEDRRALRTLVRQSNDLFYAARERKYAMLPTLHKFHEENYIDTGHYYVQVVDYISEMCKALVHITRPCYEHIDNNHRGMSEEQVEDLTAINNSVSELYTRINDMLQANDFAQIDLVLAMRDELFDLIAQAIKNQLRRIQNNSTSTKASMLYLTILNETKTMVLQSRNLLKSQKYFVEAQRTEAK